MKIRYILSLLTVAFLLGSCATPKVAYFTDLKRGTAEQVLNPLEIRIRPEDKISIQVNSKDPLLMNLFNLPIISRQIGTTSGTSNSQGISGYTINKDGDIDFPVLGHIHVAGMTRAEIASYIKEELVSKNLVKDPVVTVEFMNLTVSVLGEVATPGRFNIEKDKLTLLEALSMAGDLTVYGKREKGGRDAQRQGWSRVFHTETLCRKGLSRSEIQKACTSHPESRLRACFPKTDHGFQKKI
jgi:polysaccharide biosynthesis/export protein